MHAIQAHPPAHVAAVLTATLARVVGMNVKVVVSVTRAGGMVDFERVEGVWGGVEEIGRAQTRFFDKRRASFPDTEQAKKTVATCEAAESRWFTRTITRLFWRGIRERREEVALVIPHLNNLQRVSVRKYSFKPPIWEAITVVSGDGVRVEVPGIYEKLRGAERFREMSGGKEVKVELEGTVLRELERFGR